LPYLAPAPREVLVQCSSCSPRCRCPLALHRFKSCREPPQLPASPRTRWKSEPASGHVPHSFGSRHRRTVPLGPGGIGRHSSTREQCSIPLQCRPGRYSPDLRSMRRRRPLRNMARTNPRSWKAPARGSTSTSTSAQRIRLERPPEGQMLLRRRNRMVVPIPRIATLITL